MAAAVIAKPDSIRLAQRLMRVGAVIEGIRLILSIATVVAGIRHNLDSNNDGFIVGDKSLVAYVGFAAWCVVQVIVIGAWLWMAAANGRGFGWARVIATGLFIVSGAGSLRVLLNPGPLAMEISRLLLVALGGVIVYLLWAGDGSTEYYNASHR